MGRIARVVGGLVAIALLGAGLVGTASALPASAATYPDVPGRQIIRWDQTYTLHDDGSADVRIEFDFDFGNAPGHGPYLTVPTRMGYDADHDRLYDVTSIWASSPTGAPDAVHIDEGRNSVAIRIGDENIGNVAGVHTYVVGYRVDGVMNHVDGRDEFFWNAIGTEWVIPISNVVVTVKAPADVLDVTCFAGRKGNLDACGSAGTAGRDAVFTEEHLWSGEALTVVVAYPGGSFATEPTLIVSNDFKRAFTITPLTVGAALAILAMGLGAIALAIRTFGRDRQYRDVIPGLTPHPGTDHADMPAARRGDAVVQFHPPTGLRPGQLGTLIDSKADPRDVAATLVDLAVRGYVRIEEVGSDSAPPASATPEDYRLVKLKSPGRDLEPFEKRLLKDIFKRRTEVTLLGLRTTFASSMAAVQKDLYEDVVARGWFRRNPQTARSVWFTVGLVILSLGVLLTFALAQATTVALVAVSVPILGIVVIATMNKAPARTAAGSAVLAQTRGFKHYLETAEARQLVLEEGEDVFSRYLPFAIAFGITDAWAKRFAELAEDGTTLAEPTWYHGLAFGTFWANAAHLGKRMDGFASLASSAMSAPTPGSSGGSGFSSGGGAGGGGGGGGGGGW